MIKYSTISLPKELYDKLQEILEENPDMGYSSVADFCKEAIRLHVQEIKQELREDFLRSVDVPLLVKKIQSISAADEGTYGKIFEKMNCIAFLFSSSYKMKYCNKEFLDHFGYSRIEDVVGKDVSKFFEDKNLQKKIKRDLNCFEFSTRYGYFSSTNISFSPFFTLENSLFLPSLSFNFNISQGKEEDNFSRVQTFWRMSFPPSWQKFKSHSSTSGSIFSPTLTQRGGKTTGGFLPSPFQHKHRGRDGQRQKAQNLLPDLAIPGDW